MSSGLSHVEEVVSEPTGLDLDSLPFSALISALSFALDLTEAHPMGHVLRSCVIGMRIGEQIHLPQAMLSHLYSSLLLKDVGCKGSSSRKLDAMGSERYSGNFGAIESTVFGRHNQKDSLEEAHPGIPTWERAQQGVRAPNDVSDFCDCTLHLPCERAAHIAQDLGMSFEVSEAVCQVDERWDGSGTPNGLQGEEISLLARITNVAQTLDVAAERYGRSTAVDLVSKRGGSWFDKELTAASNLLHDRHELWGDLGSDGLLSHVVALYPKPLGTPVDTLNVDNVCLAFAEVVDAKSPFTFRHSTGVARVAVAVAKVMGLDAKSIRLLRRASLLHDIGKLGVPDAILEKPGKLTAREWRCIYKHPSYTREILDRIPGFKEISAIAAAHHEKLDGSGYPRGLRATDLPLLARILTVADMYDALSSSRPYRKKLESGHVFSLMKGDAPHAIDQSCLEALADVVE